MVVSVGVPVSVLVEPSVVVSVRVPVRVSATLLVVVAVGVLVRVSVKLSVRVSVGVPENEPDDVSSCVGKTVGKNAGLVAEEDGDARMWEVAQKKKDNVAGFKSFKPFTQDSLRMAKHSAFENRAPSPLPPLCNAGGWGLEGQGSSLWRRHRQVSENRQKYPAKLCNPSKLPARLNKLPK